jgi:hypothetical protein
MKVLKFFGTTAAAVMVVGSIGLAHAQINTITPNSDGEMGRSFNDSTTDSMNRGVTNRSRSDNMNNNTTNSLPSSPSEAGDKNEAATRENYGRTGSMNRGVTNSMRGGHMNNNRTNTFPSSSSETGDNKEDAAREASTSITWSNTGWRSNDMANPTYRNR